MTYMPMGQPQITPGQNGYLDALPVPTLEGNPWNPKSVGQQTQSALDQSQANLAKLYPTFQNSMGLGTQNAFQAPAPQSATPPSPSAQALPDSGSRGFNPWSLVGEANAR